VLLPTVYLPCTCSKPRYRELVRVCLDGEHEFGVVLIARGSEVGRRRPTLAVGTVARIVEAAELPDGRWALGTIAPDASGCGVADR